MKYVVDFSGQTEGAKSKKRIEFEAGKPVECNKDDLKHLGDHVSEYDEKKSGKGSGK